MRKLLLHGRTPTFCEVFRRCRRANERSHCVGRCMKRILRDRRRNRIDAFICSASSILYCWCRWGPPRGGRLTAAVTNAGGFGLVGSGYADADAIRRELTEAGNASVSIGFILWGKESVGPGCGARREAGGGNAIVR